MSTEQNEKAICVECDHYEERSIPVCLASVLSRDFVTGRESYWFCHIVNHNGDCQKFEPRVPLWKRLVQITKGRA